jgi:hypothetical protein
LTRRSGIGKKERSELDGFSHENPDPVLKVWEGRRKPY